VDGVCFRIGELFSDETGVFLQLVLRIKQGAVVEATDHFQDGASRHHGVIHDVIYNLKVGLLELGTGNGVFRGHLTAEVVLFRDGLAACVVTENAAFDGGGVFKFLSCEVLVGFANAGGNECV